MAGPKIRKKLKKKPVKKITTRDPGFGKVKPPIASVIKSMIPGLGNAAVQGFKKLIKQGYSEKEAIKMLSNPARRKMED